MFYVDKELHMFYYIDLISGSPASVCLESHKRT